MAALHELEIAPFDKIKSTGKTQYRDGVSGMGLVGGGLFECGVCGCFFPQCNHCILARLIIKHKSQCMT